MTFKGYTVSRMHRISAMLLLSVCLFGCVQTYSRSFTGTLIGLSPSELSPRLGGIVKERGFSLLGSRENQSGYSSIDEYERRDAVSQKRIAIGIYFKEGSQKEITTEMRLTVDVLGWEEETKKLVNEDFDSLLAMVETHFSEQVRISKKSEPW